VIFYVFLFFLKKHKFLMWVHDNNMDPQGLNVKSHFMLFFVICYWMFMPTKVKKKFQTRKKNRQLEKVLNKHCTRVGWGEGRGGEGGEGGDLLVLVEMGTWGLTTFDHFSNECGQFAPKTQPQCCFCNTNLISLINRLWWNFFKSILRFA